MASLPVSEESRSCRQPSDRNLLKLQVPARLFIRRRVFCVLWEKVKVTVVQRPVHLSERNRTLTLWSVYRYHIETLKDTHRWRERRAYGSLAKAVPVEALKPPEGQGRVAMTTVLSPTESSGWTLMIGCVSLVFLDVLHSVFLVSQPLGGIVPEKHTHRL